MGDLKPFPQKVWREQSPEGFEVVTTETEPGVFTAELCETCESPEVPNPTAAMLAGLLSMGLSLAAVWYLGGNILWIIGFLIGLTTWAVSWGKHGR